MLEDEQGFYPGECGPLRLAPEEWEQFIDGKGVYFPREGLDNFADLEVMWEPAENMERNRNVRETGAKQRRARAEAIARGEEVPAPYNQEREERKNLLDIGRRMRALRAVHGEQPGPGCISLEQALALGVVAEDDVPEYAIRKLFVFHLGEQFLADVEVRGDEAARPDCLEDQDLWWRGRDRALDVLLTPGEWRLWLHHGASRSKFQFQAAWERAAAQLPVEQVLGMLEDVEKTLLGAREGGVFPDKAWAIEVAADGSQIVLIAEDRREVALDTTDTVEDGVRIPPEDVAKAEWAENGAVVHVPFVSVGWPVRDLWREHLRYEMLLEMARERVNPCLGSSFEDFLREEGIFEEVDREARAKVAEWQRDAPARGPGIRDD
jgi:hypothetical protein